VTTREPQSAPSWRKTRLGIVAGLVASLLFGAGASVLVATPAFAACGKEGIHLGTPYQSSHFARGQSFMDNTCAASQIFTVKLQRKGALGHWPTVASGTLSVSQSPILSWDCTGAHYTYRQIVEGRTVGGTPFTVISGTARFPC
jgi:hypothetical protein